MNRKGHLDLAQLTNEALEPKPFRGRVPGSISHLALKFGLPKAICLAIALQFAWKDSKTQVLQVNPLQHRSGSASPRGRPHLRGCIHVGLLYTMQKLQATCVSSRGYGKQREQS
eukprot:5021890-Amphidinium_carterae.1